MAFVLARPEESRSVRFGIAVSRRVNRAVDRNRIRRRIRWALQQRIENMNFNGSIDMVLVARPAVLKAEMKDIHLEIAEIFRRTIP